MNDASFTHRPIEFLSQQVILRGRLYLPIKKREKKLPSVIMAHGFTTTIDHMTADIYAENFREAGFAVLLYDHRNLGISDGEPRQEVNFWVQTRGYLDALNFLCTQPEIDKKKITVWGASMSAREAFVAGMIDHRIRAIVNLVPAFGDSAASGRQKSNSFSIAHRILKQENIAQIPHTSTELMPVVSHDQITQPSRLKELTAYNWFMEHGGRFGSNWKNAVSVVTTEIEEDFHASDCAEHIQIPVLMIVAKNDEMQGADPEVTKAVFRKLKGPKEWVDISGGHFGLLYHPSPIFDKSSRAQINFLTRQLRSN